MLLNTLSGFTSNRNDSDFQTLRLNCERFEKNLLNKILPEKINFKLTLNLFCPLKKIDLESWQNKIFNILQLKRVRFR